MSKGLHKDGKKKDSLTLWCHKINPSIFEEVWALGLRLTLYCLLKKEGVNHFELSLKAFGTFGGSHNSVSPPLDFPNFYMFHPK